jgi:hypothetical protein
MSKIPEQLINAYFATDYQVFCHRAGTGKFFQPAPVTVHLKVGETSDDLKSLHEDYRVTTSAFITAYNPESQPTDADANQRSQSALIEEVKLRWKFLHGQGVDPTGQWPAEPSILVFGISLDDARLLGQKYRQNAFPFGDINGQVVLVSSHEEEPVALQNEPPVAMTDQKKSEAFLARQKQLKIWLAKLPEVMKKLAEDRKNSGYTEREASPTTRYKATFIPHPRTTTPEQDAPTPPPRERELTALSTQLPKSQKMTLAEAMQELKQYMRDCGSTVREVSHSGKYKATFIPHRPAALDETKDLIKPVVREE